MGLGSGFFIGIKMNTCYICEKNADIKSNFDSDTITVNCAACLKYVITRSAAVSLPTTFNRTDNTEVSRAKLSHYLRQLEKHDENPPLISSSIIDKVLTCPLPSPKEQADLLIRWIGDSTNLGTTATLIPDIEKSVVGSLSGAGVMLIVSYWEKKGLIEIIKSPVTFDNGPFQLKLTLSGWMYYDDLNKGYSSYKKAFIAMKFGDDELNTILNNVFRPSVKDAGFELVKLDDTPKAGLLDNRLRVEIQSSDFIIADLTHDNLGAYWEAGYAEGLGKPVIYTCKKSKFEHTKTHFDTNHHLTIIWDPETAQDAGDQLKAAIRATLPHLAKMRDD